MTRKMRVVVGATVAALLVTSACSTKANNSSSGSSGGGGSVKTGPGVTADTITLGDLTDLHGVFAALGKSITNANKVYWDQQNANGGVCGRKVNIVVKDHGYVVQQALPLYQQLRNSVLSLQQSLGSPINTALLSQYTSDKMLAIPSAWASTLLANQYIMNVGSTYDFEMINLVDFALDKKLIASGDKIGHIYFEGEYGSNGLTGSKFAASKNNLTVIEEKIKATDQDVSAQVADLKSKGAKAILLTAGPLQSASASAAAEASGYNVPILSQNPGFSPGLMATPAAAALQKHFYIVVPWLQPSSDNAEVKKAIDAYKQKFPGAQIDGGITWGYGAAAAYKQVLQKACDNKDLTREGIYNAFRSLSDVDTNGIFPKFDYTKVGDAATHEAYIWKVDKSAPGALVAASDGLFKGKDVDAYKAPAAK